jgi:tryptophan-rich sensory protein
MKTVLRIIAVVVGLAVVVNAIFIVQSGHGGFSALLRSGPLGFLTTAGWLVIMVAGAVGAILLWQMRRLGLVVTVALCRVALVYYIVGFLFRAPQSSVIPILAAAAVNGLVLAVLASSAARRTASVDRSRTPRKPRTQTAAG